MKKVKDILMSSSEKRLEELIEERLRENSNKEIIDKRIWDLFGEEWAIMFTDLSGFSRNIERFGIIHFLQTIYESEKILSPIIKDYEGILLKTEGDSLLIIFRSVKKALECSVNMQLTLEEINKNKVDEEKILLCLGIGFGRVLRIGDSDVFGAEVNAASKLGEDIAKAKEILVTEAVRVEVEDSFDFIFEDIKEIPSGAKKAYKVIYKKR